MAALRFLTVLPVPGRYGARRSDLAGSVWFFPLVGLVLGALAAAAAWSLTLVVPPLVSSAVLVIVLIAFSGGLHLDGLCDAADGLLSARPRQRAMEIMKDSRVGTMGVMALMCVLLLKFASLASMPDDSRWRAAALMPLAGRCAMVMHLALLDCARPDGLAAAFYSRRRYPAAVLALAVLIAVSWALLGMAGCLAAGASLVGVLVLAAYFRWRIGGATGDTLGAACEMIEIVPACAIALGYG